MGPQIFHTGRPPAAILYYKEGFLVCVFQSLYAGYNLDYEVLMESFKKVCL